MSQPIQPFIQKQEDAAIGLISCMRADLLRAGALAKSAGITAHHFASPLDTVFVCMMGMWTDSQEFDWLDLIQRMRTHGKLTRDGEKENLKAAIYADTLIHTAQTHINALLECAAARKMHEIGSRLMSRAFDLSEPTTELLDEVRGQLSGVTTRPVENKTGIKGFVVDAIAAITSKLNGDNEDHETIELGLGLDRAAGPFYRSDLVIVAGETKRGKSALAGNIVENVAAAGKAVALFSLEMSGRQNAERMLASQAGVNIRSLKMDGPMPRDIFDKGPSEFERLTKAAARIVQWNINVFEKTKKIEHIVAEMHRLKATTGLDLAVVDYAQLTKGIRNDGDTREREVASISGLLKEAAGACNCVVILLSQLTEQGKLRESRALGQDANCVLAIEEEGNGRKISVVAARSAPGSEIPIKWEPQYTRFSEASE